MPNPEQHALLGFAATTSFADGLVLVAIPLAAARASSNSVGVVVAVVALTWVPGILAVLGSARLVNDRGTRSVLTGLQSARATVLLLPLLAAQLSSTTGMLITTIAAAAIVANGSELAVDNTIEVVAATPAADEQLMGIFGSLRSVELTFNRLIGPLFGALAFQHITYWIFLVAGGLYSLSLALVPHLSAVTMQSESTARSSFRSSFSLVIASRSLRLSLILIAAQALSVGLTTSVLTIFVDQTLGGSPAAFGAIVGASALGGVLVGLISGRLDRVDLLRMLLFGFSVTAVAQAVLGASPNVGIAIGAALVFGAGASLGGVAAATLRQSAIEDTQRAHVASVFRVVAAGLLPLGAALGGFAASWWNLRTPWFLGAGVQLLALVFLIPGWHEIRESYARQQDATPQLNTSESTEER